MVKPSEKKTHVDSRYWITPPELYKKLDDEFHFNFDPCPCPYQGYDGCGIEWEQSNWVNPPFRAKDSYCDRGPTAFTRKAIEENKKGKTCVLILPVQGYVNMLFEAGAECRSVGRVKWLDATTGKQASSPSNNALFILRGGK